MTREERARWRERLTSDVDMVWAETVLLMLDALEAVEKQRDEAVAVLGEVEWQGTAGWGPPACPSCEGFDPSQVAGFAKYPLVKRLTGHLPGCRLAAVLRDKETA